MTALEKSDAAHEVMIVAAKILAMSAYDIWKAKKDELEKLT